MVPPVVGAGPAEGEVDDGVVGPELRLETLGPDGANGLADAEEDGVAGDNDQDLVGAGVAADDTLHFGDGGPVLGVGRDHDMKALEVLVEAVVGRATAGPREEDQGDRETGQHSPRAQPGRFVGQERHGAKSSLSMVHASGRG